MEEYIPLADKDDHEHVGPGTNPCVHVCNIHSLRISGTSLTKKSPTTCQQIGCHAMPCCCFASSLGQAWRGNQKLQLDSCKGGALKYRDDS